MHLQLFRLHSIFFMKVSYFTDETSTRVVSRKQKGKYKNEEVKQQMSFSDEKYLGNL